MSEERLAALRRLVERDPDDEVAQYGLARACLQLARLTEAERALERALALKPDWSAAWRELGRARLEDGRPDEALETFRRGLEVARQRGDLQTAREIEVLVKRALRRGGHG